MHGTTEFEGSQPSRSASLTWKPLRLLSFYRIILAGILSVLFFGLPGNGPLGSQNPSLYAITCLGYVLFSLASGFSARLRKPGFELQTSFQILVDIIAILLLMYASGGQQSGLGVLLVITIAAGSLLMPGRTGYLYAAIAALCVLGEYFYGAFIQGQVSSAGYTSAGLLGAALFATAGLAHMLARRLRESEALAESRRIDLANLANLNAHIIQRLQAGIVVVDSGDQIRLMNQTARKLLGIRTDVQGHSLANVSAELDIILNAWRRSPDHEPALFRSAASTTDILPRITLLGTASGIGALIFLEDTAVMARQAQQMKLASLGRLTASIAHEIRNPLGAISHAAQLLAESESLDKADNRLTEIIRDHTQRVNAVVENVLQLSRRGPSRPQHLSLLSWLTTFADELVRYEGISPGHVTVEVQPRDMMICTDPGHLHQIVWNLCQNGLSHGISSGADGRLILRGGYAQGSLHPYLDVLDNGPGITPDTAEQIFEPFFTTTSRGTGLGLYLARELCECNQASLSYHPVPDGGSRFRIRFLPIARLTAKSA
jgi:two-component system sensor histidine kinase PilS (NtrC family)